MASGRHSGEDRRKNALKTTQRAVLLCPGWFRTEGFPKGSQEVQQERVLYSNVWRADLIEIYIHAMQLLGISLVLCIQLAE